MCNCLFISCNTNWKWETIETTGKPTPRHEAAFAACNDKLYLIGGRRINPTDEFDTKTNTWIAKSEPPIEIHHFQPVVVGNAIYIIGAMSGKWPTERPLERVLIYYPEKDKYEYSHEIPIHRRRGGAGAVFHNGKIYIVGGITKGHMNGYKPWLDEYNPTTGEWKVLPDAPDTRDHFQAAVIDDKLYAFAGRRTSKITNQDMSLTNSHGNIFDFSKNKWETVTNNLEIPTKRAGNGVFVWNEHVVVGGGESIAQEKAHDEIEAYNTVTGTWSKLPPMKEGRHGSGYAIVDKYVYTASGSGNRGGGPELTTIERLKLSKKIPPPIGDIDNRKVYKKWHTIELPFEGPTSSETATDNPFLNYRLLVTFEHKNVIYTVRGFYATDGNAAETSAEKGNIWKVRFTPDNLGEWTYSASLQHQDNIALKDDTFSGENVSISNAEGAFLVVKSDKETPDFRAQGRLMVDKGFYKFKDSDKYLLKCGANSPENLLGYQDFDNTYRMEAANREGEANANKEIHAYAPHLKDWKTGDPSWKNGKGKSLIGALNYLSGKGMNSVYFLTMNIGGDGKDVWPYLKPDDFTRFDVSKLEQWEIVFKHMQTQGILLHFVLQETENETLLDEGDTGPARQLYYRELIARFGHHLALNWNLGEENGPAPWSPIGQNDRQRKAMAKFIKENDPYNHPVLIHTHSYEPLRSEVLDSLLGYKYLDGLSLQQDKREHAPEVLKHWKNKAKATGHDWLITMDEIGMWYTGAVTDSEDLKRDSLRQYVLWGTLLSGGAGVEWYFGAKHPHNDLTSEDWRQRDRLWEITNHAKNFFNDHLPFQEMEANHELVSTEGAYCLQKQGEFYALYFPTIEKSTIDLSDVTGEFEVMWFNPLKGGNLNTGTIEKIKGGGIRDLGFPPNTEENSVEQDWVCLLKLF